MTEKQAIKRIVYLGTPQMAVPPLEALHAAGFEIPLVISRADKRRGRGSSLHPSPVKAAALELGIPVSTDVDDVLEVDADLGVVVAFGRIIKPHVLEQLSMVNLHFSLLPRWRGAAPVERAILAGDVETGVCVMAVAEGLDTGGIYSKVTTPIGSDDTASGLADRLVEIGTELLVATLRSGLGAAAEQIGDPVYAEKLGPDDFRLDVGRSASELLRQIRIGRAWSEFRGSRFRIWDAAVAEADEHDGNLAPGEFSMNRDAVVVGTAEGRLRLIEVQPEGKARMDADAWRNGAQPTADDRLT